MTESKSSSPSSSSIGSDESLVLIESADVPRMTLPPAITATLLSDEESANVPLVTEASSESSESPPPTITATLFSDEESAEASSDTPPHVITDTIATDSQIVNDDAEEEKEQTTTVEDEDGVTRERKVGAGIAIGMVTAPFCGPVLAVMAGCAAAYGTSKPGATGDICRAAGDIAIVAKEKAIEVDKKHDIMNKTKESANRIIDKAKNANEKHHIMENVQKMISCTLGSVANALQIAADKIKKSRSRRKQRRDGATDDDSIGSDYSYERVKVGVGVDDK